MQPEEKPIVVPAGRLIDAIRKTNRADLVEAITAPAEESLEGFESTEAPPTDEEVRQLLDELDQAARILGEEGDRANVMVAPDDELTSLLQSLLAEKSIEFGKIGQNEDGELEAQFDERDLLRWARSLLTWIRGIKKHAWHIAPAAPDPLPNQFNAAVLGDWGTGLYGAPVCAATIQNDARDYRLLLHLGDVYYSGTEKEVQDRFLNIWPKKPNAISRSCNANHEMYTGGYAYFDMILTAFKQPASYFALQNDNWLLVGLDSAYHQWHYAGDQIAWLNQLAASAGDRKLVLFTHHQLFSWADKVEATMQTELGQLLNSGKIFAWYWGHEHRCVVYDRHPLWGLFGRCVGHGGYPYFTDKFADGTVADIPNAQGTSWRKVTANERSPGAMILQGPNPYLPGETTKYGPNGFLSLEFDGASLKEIYHTPDGSVTFQQTIT